MCLAFGSWLRVGPQLTGLGHVGPGQADEGRTAVGLVDRTLRPATHYEMGDHSLLVGRFQPGGSHDPSCMEDLFRVVAHDVESALQEPVGVHLDRHTIHRTSREHHAPGDHTRSPAGWTLGELATVEYASAPVSSPMPSSPHRGDRHRPGGWSGTGRVRAGRRATVQPRRACPTPCPGRVSAPWPPTARLLMTSAPCRRTVSETPSSKVPPSRDITPGISVTAAPPCPA